MNALREEVETLAAFLRLLQEEYNQLQHDFAAVLRASGGNLTAGAADFAPTAVSTITRTPAHADGTMTFHIAESNEQ